jgi:SAM-dependent methyltransferase
MPVWDIFRKKKKEDGYEDFNDFHVKERRRWTDEALHEDVKYALQVGKAFIGWLPQGISALGGKVVLEIGPGLNFGSTLYLTCFGARALVVDPYLAAWDDEYHPRFYALLRDAILKEAPEQDITPFNRILAYGGYDPDILKPVLASLEELETIASSSVDYVFSNAVLEHIYDPQRAFKSLARITRPGGMGFHQVDFRDHRNMDTPLEFLLLTDADFVKLAEECHYECGNRWRPYEYEELFRRVGFEIVAPPWGLQVDGNYHKSFIPRLRAAQGSKYQHCNEEYLYLIGGFFKVQKPKGEK